MTEVNRVNQNPADGAFIPIPHISITLTFQDALFIAVLAWGGNAQLIEFLGDTHITHTITRPLKNIPDNRCGFFVNHQLAIIRLLIAVGCDTAGKFPSASLDCKPRLYLF